MDRPRVAGIVLNYNGRELTLDTVESLLAMGYPALEIVVVDNGSTDGSHQAVGERFPQVARVRAEENRWIPGGLNLGLDWAMERDHDYLLLLNNDIQVAPTMLEELVAAAEADPAIGCVGPKCYYHGDRRRLWSAGGIIRFMHSVTRERGMGEIDRGQYDRDQEVPYINGCAALLRRRAVALTGPMDTAYKLGVEDADFCTRMKRHGYRCWFAHRAVLWHRVSHTVGGYTAGRTFHTGRSSAIFVRRHAAWHQWLSFLFCVKVAIPAAWLRELPRGNQAAAVAKLRGVLEGLRMELPPPPGPYPEDGSGNAELAVKTRSRRGLTSGRDC